MSGRKRLRVLMGPPGSCWAEVSGWRARDLLLDVGARPMWLAGRKAWSTTLRRASDVICLAELRGYVVEVVEEPHAASGGGRDE